ncbi:hypothetical protein KAR91_45680 [Candidatus Pacearchaeota archaeon]|nr:hypothetical protein [Candidatus Pacearchaeota archaeon]
MYIVYREGVYMQGIIGLFEDKENAKDAAIKAMGSEKDDYHRMMVIEMPLNDSCILDDLNGYRLEEKGIYRVFRKDGVVHIEVIEL